MRVFATSIPVVSQSAIFARADLAGAISSPKAKEQMMEPASRERIDTLVAKGTAYQDRYEFIDGLTWPDGAGSRSTSRPILTPCCSAAS